MRRFARSSTALLSSEPISTGSQWPNQLETSTGLRRARRGIAMRPNLGIGVGAFSAGAVTVNDRLGAFVGLVPTLARLLANHPDLRLSRIAVRIHTCKAQGPGKSRLASIKAVSHSSPMGRHFYKGALRSSLGRFALPVELSSCGQCTGIRAFPARSDAGHVPRIAS